MMNNDKKDAIQYRKELTKPVTKIFEKRKVLTYGVNDIWTADLVDYKKFSPMNNGYKYLLCVMDIYSRYAFVFPIKDKFGSTIVQCFKKIKEYNKIKEYGNNLWIDEGGEFLNSEFRKFCKENEINLYHTYGESKAVYIERFNRTLKTKINNYFIEENTSKYIDVLDDIVKEYNNSIHRTIKAKPKNVYLSGQLVNAKINLVAGREEIRYRVGDHVRISKVKRVFEKGYEAKWTKEVFKIVEINGEYDPVMFTIEDLQGEKIKGKFYAKELQKTELKDYSMIEDKIKSRVRDGKKEYLVKYDGYSDKFNEWLPENKVIMRK